MPTTMARTRSSSTARSAPLKSSATTAPPVGAARSSDSPVARHARPARVDSADPSTNPTAHDRCESRRAPRGRQPHSRRTEPRPHASGTLLELGGVRGLPVEIDERRLFTRVGPARSYLRLDAQVVAHQLRRVLRPAPRSRVQPVGCTYSVSLQINQILHAAEFVTPRPHYLESRMRWTRPEWRRRCSARPNAIATALRSPTRTHNCCARVTAV
jgi:hypothetical protein